MCVFCSELRAPSFIHSVLQTPWPYPDRVLFSMDTVVAIPGLGPLVYPYVLLVTRRHISSVSETLPEERSDMLRSLRLLEASGIFPSGEISVFEHGGCGRGTSSCIDHCHLHLVDNIYSLQETLSREHSTQPAVVSASTTICERGNYLFAGTFEGSRITGAYATCAYEPSQYFRRHLAEKRGQGYWNWRMQMNSHWMSKAMEAFRAYKDCDVSSDRWSSAQ